MRSNAKTLACSQENVTVLDEVERVCIPGREIACLSEVSFSVEDLAKHSIASKDQRLSLGDLPDIENIRCN